MLIRTGKLNNAEHGVHYLLFNLPVNVRIDTEKNNNANHFKDEDEDLTEWFLLFNQHNSIYCPFEDDDKEKN